MKLLVRIYGKTYFEEALIDRFYVFEESRWEAVNNKLWYFTSIFICENILSETMFILIDFNFH